MIIEETHEAYEVRLVFDITADLHQNGDWIQIDKRQAAQLVEVLQKWLTGEEVE